MSKFKVGDRVRVTDESGSAAYKVGETGTVARVTPVEVGDYTQLIELEGKNGSAMFSERFEPVAAAPAAATLTVKAGRYYKTRDGRKVGPLRDDWDIGPNRYHVTEGILTGQLWSISGKTPSCESEDLVAEWVDEPVAAHKFKVGDRVRCLKDYPGQFTAGYESVVRYYDAEDERLGVVSDDAGDENGIGASWFEPEPAAVAPTTAAEPEEPAPYAALAVGSPVLIPGWITAINHSAKGTVYSIAFETRNRRVSLHFTEEDFIPVDTDDDCPCFAENDNWPLPLAPNTAAAFDDLCSSIFGLTMRAA